MDNRDKPDTEVVRVSAEVSQFIGFEEEGVGVVDISRVAVVEKRAGVDGGSGADEGVRLGDGNKADEREHVIGGAVNVAGDKLAADFRTEDGGGGIDIIEDGLASSEVRAGAAGGEERLTLAGVDGVREDSDNADDLITLGEEGIFA